MSLGDESASVGYRAWDGQQVIVPEAACVCGGAILAVSPAEVDIRAAIDLHNAGPQHQVWRERQADEP